MGLLCVKKDRANIYRDFLQGSCNAEGDIRKLKVKVTWIYTAPNRETSKALRHGSHSFTCKQHHACFYLVSVHQMAPPLIVVWRRHLIAAYYSLNDPERMRGWVGLSWTIYQHNWSPVSCRSSAGQGKFAGQRPAFYRCTRILHRFIAMLNLQVKLLCIYQAFRLITTAMTFDDLKRLFSRTLTF